ncbi:MAG: enoyl-CoA hydratase/isomerase family protein [Dehalococcoidia bacterium]|nr:enoyl-CoA hydratase/isomerase family protein [Dehalococcoidia bacterium]
MTEVKRTPDGKIVPAPTPDDVLYRTKDGAAWIALNRPDVLNAISKNVLRLLYKALERADADPAVRVVILTGEGRSFSAGGDLNSARYYPDADPAPTSLEVQMKIWGLSKPVIAMVRGHALGQACELAGVCDMTIASEDAQFGEIQIRNGSLPPVLITPFLVTLKHAKEILLLGDVLSATEAARVGLVNKVVPSDKLQAETEALARKFAALSQHAVKMNKALINRVYELAHIQKAMDYRDDPAIAAALEAGRADALTQERRKTLQEQGWDAFKESRDKEYK